MTNRLPLPLATIKEISNSRDTNSDLNVLNPLKNLLRKICEYEYQEAIQILGFLKEEYPSLLNYSKCINGIKNAEKRYNSI
jgi:hypothetical protein